MKKIIIIILFAVSINGYSQFCHANFGFYTDYSGNAYFQNYSYSEHINDSIIEHTWLFGDGTFSNMDEPTHHYFSPGDYDVCHIIETSFGCIDTICWIVTITDYCTLEIIPIISNVTIYGSANGEISLDVNLGLPPYDYIWNTGDTTNTIDSLAAGMYSVTVCYGSNCCDSIDIEVTEPDTMLYEITGTVYAGNNLLPKGIALIYERMDSSTVKAFKYGYIEDGAYALYPNKEGNYYIYAIPYVEIEYPYTPVYFPTYYGDALLWEDAQMFNFDSTKNHANISLNSNPTFLWGNAGIYGNVQYIYPSSYESTIYDRDWFEHFDDNSSKFNNARNIPIILFKNNTTPLLFTLSDENGNFSFPNLEFGTYQVYAEKAGFFSEYGEITLDSLNPVNSLSFIIGNKQIVLEKREITNYSLQNEIKVYPNPANDFMTIQTEQFKDQITSIKVINSIGQVCMNIENYYSNYKIDVSELPGGIYYLQFYIKNKISSVPVIIN